MGAEGFYATAAQVLPTILVVLAVEMGLMVRVRRREQRSLEGQNSEYPQPYFMARMRHAAWILALECVGVVFVVGEVLALLALGFEWFNAWTFWPILVCLVVLVFAAAWIPVHTSWQKRE